ncbi:angio-associated migratory cell protein-like [Hibiscus syriacus]|uniref:angio-associated migratory cell protein-like n=1 Tax=Hibiscus syriacus TaxID=106335 RepID=UPI0019220E5B|nr:angio-associated migratory cell protein-like [Hibiscus syriacus]
MTFNVKVGDCMLSTLEMTSLKSYTNILASSSKRALPYRAIRLRSSCAEDEMMAEDIDDQHCPAKLNMPSHEDEEQGEVFVDESDIIHEVDVDEEDLPDAEDEDDAEDIDDQDDSIHIFTGHTGMNGFLSLSFFSYCCLSAPFLLFLFTTGIEVELFKLPSKGLKWVRWHPKGHLILAGFEDCTVWMWNADSGNFLSVFSGHSASVTCGDFTPDGKTICTGSEDAALRIWNPRSGETIHVVRGHPYHTEGLTCLSISSDSTLAITGSRDGSVHIVNITTGKVVSSWGSQTSLIEGDAESIECVSFAPNFPWAVSGGLDRKLIIWDLQSSSPRFICDHEEGVTCLAWLGASKFLATGCVDGRICIWNCLSGECVETFKGHEHAIQSLAVSSNLVFLVSVSMDGTARVFEIRNFH